MSTPTGRGRGRIVSAEEQRSPADPPARHPARAHRHDGTVPAVEVQAVASIDEALRRELLTCWTDVTNAGGAVGFVLPVTEDDIAPALDELVRRVREAGRCWPPDRGRRDGRLRGPRPRPARCGSTGPRCSASRSIPHGRAAASAGC